MKKQDCQICKASTPKQKKKRSDGSPRSSKRKHSSKPTSDDLKSLDDKWSEKFSRLEAMLLNQSFAVPVRPVSTASVVPREHPLFDPGASTSVMFAEITGSGLFFFFFFFQMSPFIVNTCMKLNRGFILATLLYN